MIIQGINQLIQIRIQKKIIYPYILFVFFFMMYKKLLFLLPSVIFNGGWHGRDRMVVGFTTTYAISAYHH